MARVTPRLISSQLRAVLPSSSNARCSSSRSSHLSVAAVSATSIFRTLHTHHLLSQNAAQAVNHTAAAGTSHPVDPTASPPPPSTPATSKTLRQRSPASQLPVKDRLNRKTSIRFSLADSTGSLSGALQHFARHNINLSRVESRPSRRSDDVDFYVDFQGSEEDERVKALMRDLRMNVRDVHVLEGRKVPWFPRRRKDLDLIANAILDAGSDLSADHPGFHDSTYRQRRQQIADTAMQYKIGSPIPPIAYTADETATWSAIWDKLMPLLKDHACAEHVRLLPLLMENCGYRRDNIPQIQDISDFLQECTGFILRPVAGLLSARNFLYGLAFRVFFSTQYLRHHSRPLYTPEPDLVHELLGHAPLFADQSFADFSQEIGLASIGATDDQITRLARCYWFSVEFGLCKQQGQRKAFGAGLLSSFGELEYAMSDKPDIRPFDPFDAAEREYPITEYQPVYYEADSFDDAQRRIREYSESFGRLFHVRYNPYSQSLEVDGNVIAEGERHERRK